MIPRATSQAIALLSAILMTQVSHVHAGQALAGTWRFALDPDDAGLAAAWWRTPDVFKETIALPGTTDLAGKGERRSTAPDGEHHLTREFHYVGPAWFQHDINIPESWNGRRVELKLERVMWQSRAWIDGREIQSPADSLCVPHVHSLGRVGSDIAPGSRRLTLRIDNRMIHPIGDKGHAYGDQMQSIWNGAVGKLTLRPIAPGELLHARLFPDAETQTIRAELTLEPGDTNQSPAGALIVHDPDGREIARTRWQAETGKKTHEVTLKLDTAPCLWSEFEQPLYRIDIISDSALEGSAPWRENIGFRRITRIGQRLAINGRPSFFRGNLECAAFPLTGHPPVDVASWRRIWQVYREHNLNHARFHSWCPPRAAFEAADELGIYLQVEAPIWMVHWMAGPNPRPEMETAGHPQGLGKNDRSNDEFARAEIRRILDEFGNHPSFVLFCIGNELGTSDFNIIGPWMAEARAHDPRRLYAASTARTITPHCEYNATHHIPGIGACRARFSADTRWNYEETYARAPVPILAHETGQVPVYPDWSELARFTGPLKPYRLEAMRELARANGILNDAADLRAASGALNRLLNREELEGYFRTPSCAGFQLLSMQDFTGQGEALVGWRDIFFNDKGTTDSAEFRQWCAPTVPLLEISKRIWQTHKPLTAAALVHHSGPQPETHISIYWSLTNPKDDRELASGTLPAVAVKSGDVTRAGDISINLNDIISPTELRLTLAAVGREEIRNSYPLWIFPETIDSSVPDDVLLTDDWPAAKASLAAGRRVVFFTDRVGHPTATGLASWRPLYWSVPFFPGQHSQTLGLLVRNEHPAFQSFPTPSFNDWLWHDICAGAKGFDLTGLVPESWKPIAQPVSDFHYNRKLASLFELRVGPGKLLVSGYSLAPERAVNRPETAALRRSLLDYASSPAFSPTLELPVATLDEQFPEPPLELAALPEGFAKADLYIRAAGRLAERNQSRPHKPADDQILARAEGIRYTVEADGAWRDDAGSAWHGKNLRITLETRAGVPGTLHLRFHDWNRNGRTGTLTIEGETLELPAHTEARWIRFPIIREHTNDGRIVIHATATAGPNLMLTDLAFVPEE